MNASIRMEIGLSMSPTDKSVDVCLARSIEIALSGRSELALRVAAEAVASAILNGAELQAVREEAIMILRAENSNVDIALVDAVLGPERLN